MPTNLINGNDLQIFDDSAVLVEDGRGLSISSDGLWSSQEFPSVDDILCEFAEYEAAIAAFKRIKNRNANVEVDGDMMTVSDDDLAEFDENGNVPKKKVKCPQCGRMVDELGSNGFCSKTCGAAARARAAAASASQAAEQTVELINKIRNVLKMVDMVLNLIEKLPDMIRKKNLLPDAYREYVTLRIDEIFMELKIIVNDLMIMKNNYILQLLNKIKCGSIDEKLQVIFAPITTILNTVLAMQAALAAAMVPIMALLQNPLYGIPPQSYGWMMTPKSLQHPQTSGKIFIEIVPKTNIGNLMPNTMNNIDTAKIMNMCHIAMPPIQDIEYFMEPSAFKVRYAVSQMNMPAVKKFLQMLEGLVVLGADTFPRYKRLKLSNIWFVLSILTGWGPTSRCVFGDFIFHGSL